MRFKTSCLNSMRLFIVFVLVFGNFMSTTVVARADDGIIVEPAPSTGDEVPPSEGEQPGGVDPTSAVEEVLELPEVEPPAPEPVDEPQPEILFDEISGDEPVGALSSATATFQNGVSSYSGTVDSFLRASSAGTNYGSNAGIEWDNESGSSSDEIGLIRFDDLFVSEGGPIPDGATIISASLSYMTTDLDSGSTAYGDPANVYESLVSWAGSTVTYNNFGGDAGVATDEYRTPAVASAIAEELSTVYSIDVTASLQRWTANPAENLGWIFIGTNNDGVTIYSSNYATAANRPKLTVEYSTDPIPQYTLTVNAVGDGSVTLDPAGGVYNEGSTVTLTAVAGSGYEFSSWSGNLGGSDNPATITMDADKTVTANFVVSLCTTVNLTAAEDTWLRYSEITQNYGGSTTIQVSPNSDWGQGALYRWNVGSIPSNATISAASLTFHVTEGSAYAFSLYNMRRDWVEGTNNGADGTGASWTYYGAGTGNWGTAGAANTTSDRYNTNLWGAVAADFNSTGSRTFNLDADGIAVVQGWVDGSISNYGLTMQNYSGSSSDYWKVDSSEAATEANRPKLNVTYCVPSTDPTIITGGTLSAFSTQPGVPSAAQTYTVSGSNLTADISIAPPTGFELSVDGTTYYSGLILAQAGGVVDETTIYVRLTGASAGSFGGNLAHTSSGAADVNIPVSGSVVVYYTLSVTSANGTVTLDPAGGSYPAGTLVSLTAEAATGYEFDSWSGDLTGNTNPASLTMDGNKAVTANFVESSEVTLTFRYGVNSYTGADDTYLRGSTAGASNFGSEDDIEWDDNSGTTTDEIGLIRFGSLFESEGGPIPNGSTILSATLTYTTTDLNSGSTAEGDPANVYESLVSWTGSTVTYNNFGGDAGVQSDEYRSTPVISAPADARSTAYNMDVTAALQRWSLTPGQNLGWVFLSTGTDGVNIYSSDVATVTYRPMLSVTYAPSSVVYHDLDVSIVGNGSVTLNPTGEFFEEGSTVELTAVAGSGWKFGSWSGDLTGSTNPESIVMDADKSVTAIFVEMSQYTATYQYGANGYTGTDDAYIRGTTDGANNYGSETDLQWDANSGTTTDEYALIRFDDLFASEGGLIPDGANIVSATLTYMTTDLNSESTAEGDPANVYESLVSWAGSTVTYNNFGGEAGVQSNEYDSTVIDSAVADARSTVYSIDVTASLQRWSANPAENLGWIFIGTNTDGVNIYSSDISTLSYRPQLTVVYSSDTPLQYSLMVNTDGHGSVTLDPAEGVYNSGTTVQLTAVADSGYEFNKWFGDLSGSANPTTIVMTTNKTVNADFSLPGNQQPGAPVLVQPADDATDVSLSPTLEVTVSDPDDDVVNVTFYGKKNGGTGTGETFTIIALPDTQMYAQNNTVHFSAQTQWISDNKLGENIVYVGHLGDIVNTASSTTQWAYADTAMDILDAGDVTYGVLPGNHDQPTTNYNTYFGASRFSGKSYYGGNYDGTNDNNYVLFTAGGMDFLFINLQYNPNTNMLNWADGLLKTYSSRRGIVATHNLLNTNNSWSNEAIYTALKDNANLFMMLCGHMHTSSDGAAMRTETGDSGNTIYVLMSDYQDFTSGGNGYLRIMQFAPDDDKINISTYSPTLGAYETSDPLNTVSLDYDMEGGGSSFQELGTVYNLASGQNASFTWSGRTANSEYEWYAVVSDDQLTSTGATWSFTTEELDCYPLTLTHTGNGSNPIAFPANSTGCEVGEYVAGASITLTAVPDSGWQVAGWTGTNNNTSTATTNTVSMPAAAHEAGVDYVEDPDCHLLTLSHSGDGDDPTASPTSSTGCSLGKYLAGEHITLTAVPELGWMVESWTGTDNASSNLMTMPDAAHDVSVTYVQRQYTITMTPIGDGTINIEPPGPFYYGDFATVTAVPAEGWSFVEWGGHLSGSLNPESGIVTFDMVGTATFEQDCYALTLGHTGSGSNPTATPANSTGCAAGTYHFGESITLSGATPDSGWLVAGWSGTDDDASTADNNTVTMPAAAHSASVNYIETPTCYALTLGHTGNGADPAATPANSVGCPAGQYVEGAVINLSGALADSGWQIGSWTGTDDDASTADSNTVTMPAAAHSASVNYIEIPTCYALTLNHQGIGSNPTADPANSAGCPAGQYVAGANINLSGAVPAANWKIIGWMGTLADTSTADSNAVSMPAAAHEASVMYEEVIDTSQPTVTINQGAAQADPASAVPVVFDVVFSEDVTGFEAADVALTGTAKGSKVVTVSGSGAAYTVEVKGITSSGTLTAKVAAGAAQDGAANPSQASTSTDNTVTFKMPAAAGKPKLLLPASAVIIDSLKPAFDWTDSAPAAVYYQIQVGTSSRFTAASLVIEEMGLVESNYTVGADLLPGMRYYWRVRGFNAAEVAGSWTSARSFRTPLDVTSLVTVGAGEILLTDRPDFNWDNVAGATKYRIQISKANTFKRLVLNKTSANSELTPTSDLPVNSLLYWRVRAESAYVTGPWSEVRDFTTGNPPSVPSLYSPKNKALTTNYLPRLDWKNSSVPKGTVFDHYQVQVSALADFSVLLVNEETEVGVANSEYTLEDEMTPNTVYYWRVRSFNETGQYSGWSAVWTLRAAMLAPVLSAPANGGAALLTDRPEFDWEDRDGATGYVIQVSKVNTFKSRLVSKTVTSSSYVPTSDLPADTVLYWRVQAKGANGPSLWSEVWSFTTGNPPGVPTLRSPANKALTTNYLPKLDWNNSSAPTGTTFSYYQIQVSTDPVFGTTVINDTADISEFTPILVLDPNTTFYWRVRAYNTDGEVSGWSAVRTLRTAIAPPTLTSPVGGAAAGSLKPAFDWEDAAGATSYTIQVSKVNTFKSRVLSKTAAASTYTPTSNLPAGQTLYWRVQAKGPNGPSAWSAVESFVTP